MADPIEAHRKVLDQRNIQQRTVVPGLLATKVEAASREVTADFNPGIADLIGTVASPATPTPGAPVMNLVGGGFFVLFPAMVGDEVLGLVSDRATPEWRSNRSPGKADQMNGKRSKVLTDVMLTPFSITAPAGAPETWQDMVIGGPAGVAIKVAVDGAITITTSAVTITIGIDGTVDIDGVTINVGGAGAVTLAKADPLVTAIDALLVALVAAGSGPAFTGAATAQTAWNAAKGAIATTKAKGV